MELEVLLKNKLLNEQLSSVVFVQDYLQLHFDGRIITAYVWPHLIYDTVSVNFGDNNYRDSLCNFIGKEVNGLSLKDKEYLVLNFIDHDGIIKLNLDEENPEIISEIAVFSDPMDDTWIIFD